MEIHDYLMEIHDYLMEIHDYLMETHDYLNCKLHHFQYIKWNNLAPERRTIAEYIRPHRPVDSPISFRIHHF